MKIIIDGNIGCGKSSIIKRINNIEIIRNEPIEDWEEWLNLFYSDTHKNALGFQLRVLKSHLNNKSYKSGVFERSPLSCQKVFGQILFEDNFLNECEMKLINEYAKDFGWLPDIIIYLQCSPELCHQRIKTRGRESEQNIELDYLKKVHNKYEILYNSNLNIKVIKINAENDINTVFNQVIQIINKYMDFYNNYSDTHVLMQH
jgi:deoxyadenosine/deoxycytidine kinase